MKTLSLVVCSALVVALAAGASVVSAQPFRRPLIVPSNPLVFDGTVEQTLPITSCIIQSIAYKGPTAPPGEQMVMDVKCIGAPKDLGILLPDAASAQLAESNLAAKAARPPGQGGIQLTATHTPQHNYSVTWMQAF